MSEASADVRLQSLEDRVSEWDATTRVRVKNPGSILTQAEELQATSKEFWRLKEAVGKAVWSEIAARLCKSVPAEVLKQYEGERSCGLAPEGLTGVFPVGGNWDGCSVIDIRLKPCSRLGFTTFVRSVLAPKLKESDAGAVDFGIWVPLSSGEMRKRKRKHESAVGGKGTGRDEARDQKPRADRRSRRDAPLVGTDAANFPSLCPWRAV